MRLTIEEWNKLLDNKEIKDISSELLDSFLMIYQTMRAKIIWKDKKYLASAWAPPGNNKAYVELKEVSE